MRIVHASSLDTTFVYPESVIDSLRLFLTWIVSPLKWHVDGMGCWCLILTETPVMSPHPRKQQPKQVPIQRKMPTTSEAINGSHVVPRRVTDRTREVTVAAAKRFRT